MTSSPGTHSQIVPVLSRLKFQVIYICLAKDEPPPLQCGSTCQRRLWNHRDFCGKGLGTSDCTDGQSQSLSGITQGTVSSPPLFSSLGLPCVPALLPSLINYPSAFRAPLHGGWGTTEGGEPRSNCSCSCPRAQQPHCCSACTPRTGPLPRGGDHRPKGWLISRLLNQIPFSTKEK